ncbi:MAG TPA: glycosyl hydrolase, partial [Thermomicrobiaceae bacterium]|nr:glycosyl hydrolase [Thermomicrobiaceae bacterium]
MPDSATSINALIESAQKNHHTLKWRSIGPFRGGRVVAVAGHPTEERTFYFGGCAGGVWKTIDGGITWQNVSDGYFKTSAIGAIAVAESDPNVIYAGTGETAIRGNVSHGDGVYKSADGGATWTNVGLAETRYIGRIRIDPHDANHVYVAAFGHAYGPNEERGVYRTTDGGKSWEKILYKSPNAGAIDLSMDPHNPRILYATIWQAQRFPWGLSSGGPESGIFKSIDGGDSWTELTHNHGLPKGILGKIGIAVSPARPERVYAIVEAEDGALFRSDNGGQTWQRLSEQPGLRWRAWYYMHMYADPQDPDTCWVLNGGLWKSIDGGKTFRTVPEPHGDNHDLWIDPKNPQRMIEGNDGGACVTFNGARTWSSLWNQPTAQFYHVITDNQTPYTIYGSQQDNTALGGPSLSVNGAILQGDWFEPGGGESGYIAIKPGDPNIVYGGGIGSGDGNGRLLRFDRRTGYIRNVTPWPVIQGMGEGAETLKYRFQWTFPIVFSPHEPNTLYATSNHVHRTRDDGASWEVLSPDLTRNDSSKLGASGGSITKDNTGAEVYCTIFAFAESPHQAGVFWAGS